MPKTKQTDERIEALLESPTMARLLDALQAGTDIGHYGHFVFLTTARHFLEPDTLLELLAGQPEMTEERARAMLLQMEEKGYNPPKRDRILQMQSEQEFAIIPDVENPDSGNLYRELRFPETVYEDIQHYYEEKAGATVETT